MQRSIDLLVSDRHSPGRGRIVAGPYQAPILVQWRSATGASREITLSLTSFD